MCVTGIPRRPSAGGGEAPSQIEHELRVKELPKTKRGHMILLDTGPVAMLRRWRARQAEEKLLVAAGYRDKGFVFCHPGGTIYDPDRFSREFLGKQAQ